MLKTRALSPFLKFLDCAKMLPRGLLFVLLILIISVVAAAIRKPGWRKEELMLPTRDGTLLHTLIYLPRDADSPDAKFTALVDRSPYGYGDMEWITDVFLPFGIVAVGKSENRIQYLFTSTLFFSCHVLMLDSLPIP